MEIVFNNVNFSYDLKKQILNNVNFKIKNNTINSIVGPTGSGKTTLVELISALNVPDSGSIDIQGLIVKNKMKKKDLNDLRKKIGLVFQFSEDQIFNLTVLKELQFSLKDLKLSKNEIDTRIKDTMEMVNLNESYLIRNPFTLSHGELKKVALASILIRKTEVLILDEPTYCLDKNDTKWLIKLLKNLKRNFNYTIIIVSRDMDFVNKVSDNIYVMNNSNIVLSGEKKDVFKEEHFLSANGVKTPDIIEFENMVLKEKNVKLGYREEINDLLKDIFRNAK